MFDPRTDEPGVIAGPVQFLAGVFLFSSIFSLCQICLRGSKIGHRICQKYEINNNGIHDISNKITSSTFALLSCIIGRFVNQQCTGDIMRDRFNITDNFMVVAMAYFLYDLVSMYIVHNTTFNPSVSVSVKEIQKFLIEKPMIIFHHILVPLIMIPAVLHFRNGIIRGDCLIGTCLIMEASTPFVSLRVILIHLKMKVFSCVNNVQWFIHIISGELNLRHQRITNAGVLLLVPRLDISLSLLVVRCQCRALSKPSPGLCTLPLSSLHLRDLDPPVILVS